MTMHKHRRSPLTAYPAKTPATLVNPNRDAHHYTTEHLEIYDVLIVGF